MNQRRTFFPTHITLQKRTKEKAKNRKVKTSFPPLIPFLFTSLFTAYTFKAKGKSNSQPANTHSTDPTAPACITYSQPPPSSGSAADAGLSPTIFSYSCGPTQTTHVYLATATNAPASASASPHHNPISISHLPIYAYVCIGIGGVLVLLALWRFWRWCTNTPTSTSPSRYHCRHCRSTNLSYRIVQPGNRNGNVGRRYCVCVNRNCPNVARLSAGHHDTGWVTWDDNIGVQVGNPLCRCGALARRDTAGERSHWPGRQFWTCSTGACDLFHWCQDGNGSWGNGY